MNWVRTVQVGRSSDKCVLIALAWFHHKPNDRCCPSIETLSEFTELNRKTIMPALDRLRISGFIDYEKSMRTKRNYSLNLDRTEPVERTDPVEKQSSNFGTKKNGEQSPGIGTKGEKIKVPKTDNQSPKSCQLRSQNWDTIGKKDLININTTSDVVVREEVKPEKIIDPKYRSAAQAMWEKISPIKKRKQEPNLDRWSEDIRRLVEIDQVEPEIVWKVFLWANQDTFWRPNILSPAKLREKFDTLFAKWENENANTRSGESNRPANNANQRLTSAERIARRRASLG